MFVVKKFTRDYDDVLNEEVARFDSKDLADEFAAAEERSRPWSTWQTTEWFEVVEE